MRKLRLIAVIIFAAYGGHALYKYLSDDGKVFISREKLPENKVVTTQLEEIVVEQVQTSMDEYLAAHKDDLTEIINKSLTDDAIELKIEEVKPKVDIYDHKPIKRKKFKYCVKIEHKNDTPNELILRQLRND